MRRPLETFVWALALAVALGGLGYLFGVTPADFALYVGYSLVYTVCPGICLYALLARPEVHPVSLAMRGWGFGLVLEMSAYLTLAAVGLQGYFALYPLPFLAIGVIWRKSLFASLRDDGQYSRRVMAAAWVMVMVISAIAAISTHFPNFDHHFSWSAAYANAALEGWPIADPFHFGGFLDYHYMFYLHLSAAHMVTGLSTVVLSARLAPILYLAAIALASYDVARSLTGSRWLAFLFPLQTYATFGVSPIIGSWFAHAITSAMLRVPPTMAGLFVFTLVVREVLEWLGLDSSSPGFRGRAAVLGITLLAASGVRSSLLPVLGLGLGVLLIAELISTRRIPWRTVAVLGAVCVSFVIGLYVFYGFGGEADATEALTFSLFVGSAWATKQFHELTSLGYSKLVASVLALALMLVARSTFLLPGGLAFMAGAVRRTRFRFMFLCIGLYLGGVGFLVFTVSPGGTQFTFMHHAHIAFNLAAVAGLAAWVGDGRWTKRGVIVAAATAALFALHFREVGSSTIAYARSLDLPFRQVGFKLGPAYLELCEALKAMQTNSVWVVTAPDGPVLDRLLPAEVPGMRMYGARRVLEPYAGRANASAEMKAKLENLKILQDGPDNDGASVRTLARIQSGLPAGKRLFIVDRGYLPIPPPPELVSIFENRLYRVLEYRGTD